MFIRFVASDIGGDSDIACGQMDILAFIEDI